MVVRTHYRDGKVVMYQRGKKDIYQARIKIGRGAKSWKRISTNTTDLHEASRIACKKYDRAIFRMEEGFSPDTKSFSTIAEITIKEMDDQLIAGHGKVIYKDYINVINKWFIPYFKDIAIDTITTPKLNQFDQWRISQFGRIPAQSTIKTHNSSLRRVFNTALNNGWLLDSQVPSLTNKGVYTPSESRPYFTKKEYHTLYTFMSKWCLLDDTKMNGVTKKSRYIRQLLYDYVMIVANSGMRPGTETYNLKWSDISFGYKNKKRFIKMKVKGKTGERVIVVRDNTKIFLKNIASRFNDLKDLSWKDLFKQDEYVFRLIDGTRSEGSMMNPFKRCLKSCELLKDSQGKVRTLYSLRHSYITWGLLDGISIHLLAKQCGTSVAMIERHYSHVIPELQADILAGWDPKQK